MEKRINSHKIEYATYRAKAINGCRELAWGRYQDEWDNTCVANNRLPDCHMETTQSAPINARLDREYDRCLKQY